MSSILKRVEEEKAKGTFGKTAEDPSHCLELCWLYSAKGIMHRVQGRLISRLGSSSQTVCSQAGREEYLKKKVHGVVV